MPLPWFQIENIDALDSPALAVYPDRVKQNIETLVQSIDKVHRLRPHVKTHKSAEVSAMMLGAGITKFKCATIAEAEMLAGAEAPDVLLAYQPVGPKAERFIELMKKFKGTKFSCLLDNAASAVFLSEVALKHGETISVFIDLNVGMNRTGITPDLATALYESCRGLKGLTVVGLHAYDGHIRDVDYAERKKKCDDAYVAVQKLSDEIERKHGQRLTIVAGGTPTYSVHVKRERCECSPGTFIYWDKGYEQILTEQHYLHAAVVITRVISKPTEDTICVDLGHKAIASENPLDKRVIFLNADVEPVGHSEEHMVLRMKPGTYNVGDVFYGVPYHVCPTIALHDKPAIVEGGRVVTHWTTLSRNRSITV